MSVKNNIENTDLLDFIEDLKKEQLTESEASEKNTKVKKSKGLGLFDHVRHVNQVQDPKYFDKISDDDKKTWSNWMVLKSLSNNPNYVDAVNELQMCLGLKPEILYLVLIDIFPKDKGFHGFIKGKSRERFGDELIDLIKNHFEISSSQAIDYLKIFYMNEENKKELVKIISLYGKTEKEIKEILKR